MSAPAAYLLFYMVLLVSGFILFRTIVPGEYMKRGQLSPLITFLQALLFFGYGGFPYLYLKKDWPRVFVPLMAHVAGVSLIVIGLGMLLYGMVRLGVIRSIGRGTPILMQSGIYARSRNPQAMACGLYVVGFFILWPSWYAAGWVLLYGILIHMMVLAEEKHLRKQHGEGYEAYCDRVPRYFGYNPR